MRGLEVLLRIALRSLISHKVKSLIVGSIIFFGTALVVVGTALIDSVDGAMRRSITQSLSGDLQLYDADAPDPLALFGSGDMGDPDVGQIPDFGAVKRVVEAVPGVRVVVPQGVGVANMSRGSELDRAIEALRVALDARTEVPGAEARVRRLLALLAEDLEKRAAVSARTAELSAQRATLREARSPTFWQHLAADPEPALQYLDTQVAPIGGDGRALYLRYMGTDLEAFAAHFDRFQIVKGQPVPAGRRGLLINQRFADSQLKMKGARLLDALHTELHINHQRIADSPALRARARQLASQRGAIILGLSPAGAGELEAALRVALPTVRGDLDALVTAALTVNDANFDARYDLFYAQIAPRVALYPFEVGGTVTVRAWTRSGYMRSANLKVWGTFSFKGLERSELSGAINLMDLISFRDLYGQVTEADRAEMAGIQREVGVKTLARDEAEAALFGGDAEIVGRTQTADFHAHIQRADRDDARPFTQGDVDHGLALNAAVLLDDPGTVDQVRPAIETALRDAGLAIQVVGWRQASGIVGQFVIVVRAVLYVAIGIIFLVALVIINNSMLMATLERAREIGTLRAMGAQRSFVMAMVFVETLALGLVSGVLGAAAGTGVMLWLGRVGIPARSDVMVFLFSGPRLYPTVGLSHYLIGLAAVLGVSLASTWYPARVATRVQPIEAMRTE